MGKLTAVLVSLLLLVALLPAVGSAIIVAEPKPPLIIVGNFPDGLAVKPNSEYTVYFMVADDYGVDINGGIHAYYRLNGGRWREAFLKKPPENPIIQSIRARFYGETQDFYVFYRRFTIPGAEAGTRVDFFVEATDVENHTSRSPVYTYYVINPSGKRVLVVDPSVEAISLLRSLASVELQLKASRERYHYNLSDVEDKIKPLERGAGSMIAEHHWEFLAEHYDLRIVPPRELPALLEEFRPEAVVLSNLWVPCWGLNGGETGALNDYLHSTGAGLIVTAGTLLDSTNPGHIGTPGNVSVASMLRMEPLQLAMVIRGALNMSDVPVAIPNVSTGYPFLLPEGKRLEINVSTAVGWQYVLPESALGIARRSLLRFSDEHPKRLLLMEEVIGNLTGRSFNISAAVSLTLQEIVAKASILDSSVTVEWGGKRTEFKPERGYLEKLRFLLAVRDRYPRLLARTVDYSGAVLTGDGDYRSAYVSLELEAGGKEEFDVLKKLVDWSMTHTQPETPEVVILANDIDWGIKGKLLQGQLEALGLKARRVTADEFETYKDSRIIVILGGPDAYDGVGTYVRQVLSLKEQNAVRSSERGIFVKADVWGSGQVVIVLAGKDRWKTGTKVSAYMEGLDSGYAELLTGFVASAS
ncbi:hypothetical protein [Thermococcus sp.]|uniref:hypothetical protein n=1 Tax=Thermococcus sp. TaxID=35749 RepID=UPI002625ED66|nr:hypothetical protein [Thermococcus sp.]